MSVFGQMVAGLGSLVAAFAIECDEEAYWDDDERCALADAIIKQGVGDPIGALYRLEEPYRDSREAARVRQAALADARALVTAAAMEVTNGEFAEARATTPRVFARELRAQIMGTKGGLEQLVHPVLGVFVVHTIPGSVPHIDRVLTWPEGDYDYGQHVDHGVLEHLMQAHRWRPGIRRRVDAMGCDLIDDTVVRGAGTAFDAWFVIFGSVNWAVPEEIWLDPTEIGSFLEQDADLAEADYMLARRAALTITHSAFVSDIRLDFGRIDGRWFLLAIDMRDDPCG
jgi:hypothetical protein